MEVIEALRTSIPEPHDHPDINHDLMFVGPGATSGRLPVTGFLPRSEDGGSPELPALAEDRDVPAARRQRRLACQPPGPLALLASAHAARIPRATGQDAV